MGRKIIHLDLDAFYASVEQLDFPEYRGKPIAVGGSPDGRGVLCTASYEARKFGVRAAMPSAKAKRLCPKLIFLPPRFDRYSEISQAIFKIYSRVTDRIEPLSLDEAYLDVTENKWGETSATRIAKRLREDVHRETGLTVSAGVAENKFLAKVASDFKKPNGLTTVPPEQNLEFISDLPVERLWGVGHVTAARFQKLGLTLIRHVREAPRELILKEFGSQAEFWLELAYGRDDRPIETDGVRKSYGAEQTFEKSLYSHAEVLRELQDLSRSIESSLIEDQCEARTVQLKVRYDSFETLTRSRTLYRPIVKASEIYQVASAMSHEFIHAPPIRLLGISVSNLVNWNDPVRIASDRSVTETRCLRILWIDPLLIILIPFASG